MFKTYTADGTGNGFEWRTNSLTFKECQEIKLVFNGIVTDATTNLNVGVRFKGYESSAKHVGFQHANGFIAGNFHYNEFVIKRIKNGIKVTETNVRGKNILGQTTQLNNENISAVYIDDNVCGEDNPIVYLGVGTSASIKINSGTIDVYIR